MKTRRLEKRVDRLEFGPNGEWVPPLLMLFGPANWVTPIGCLTAVYERSRRERQLVIFDVLYWKKNGQIRCAGCGGTHYTDRENLEPVDVSELVISWELPKDIEPEEGVPRERDYRYRILDENGEVVALKDYVARVEAELA